MNLNCFETKNILRHSYTSWIVNVVLSLLLIWLIFSLFQRQPSRQNELLPTRSENQPDRPLIDNIANMHLFGLAEVEQVPETRLNLTLSSILKSNQGENSRVLITVGSDTNSYKIGDLLPGQAVIENILRDRVLLRYQGQLEVLLLPREFLNVNRRISS